MNWPRFGVGCLIIAIGGYTLFALKDAKTGAGLIGLGALLIDPTDVLKAVGLWKGGAAPVEPSGNPDSKP